MGDSGLHVRRCHMSFSRPKTCSKPPLFSSTCGTMSTTPHGRPNTETQTSSEAPCMAQNSKLVTDSRMAMVHMLTHETSGKWLFWPLFSSTDLHMIAAPNALATAATKCPNRVPQLKIRVCMLTKNSLRCTCRLPPDAPKWSAALKCRDPRPACAR